MYGLAILAGIVGTTVKLSTGGLYLLPLLFYRPIRSRLWVVALVAIPVVAGMAWNLYADEIKAGSPATAWLTTSEQRDWYFGDLVGRLDLDGWATIAERLMTQLTGMALVVWVPLAVLQARRYQQSRVILAFLAASVLALLIVMPLYVVHDYYLAAISPMVALAVGLGATWLWGHRQRAVLATTAMAWVATAVVAPEWMRMYAPVQDHERTLEAAAYIASRTDTGDLVAVGGRGWDPSVLYYARRRGFMFGDAAMPSQSEQYALIVVCWYTAPCETIR